MCAKQDYNKNIYIKRELSTTDVNESEHNWFGLSRPIADKSRPLPFETSDWFLSCVQPMRIDQPTSRHFTQVVLRIKFASHCRCRPVPFPLALHVKDYVMSSDKETF